MVERRLIEYTPQEKFNLSKKVSRVVFDRFSRGECGVPEIRKAIQGVVNAGKMYDECDAQQEYGRIIINTHNAMVYARRRTDLKSADQLARIEEDYVNKLAYVKHIQQNGKRATIKDTEREYLQEYHPNNPFRV